MSVLHLITIAESSILLILLSLLFFWLYPSLRLDLFRQEMFQIRDDLFDYARQGNISFSHPAYKLLRRSANGFIRYGHRLTFYRIVTTSIVWKFMNYSPELRWTSDWTRALGRVDQKTRGDLLVFHERITTEVLKRLVFGSVFLISALFVVGIAAACHAGLRSVRATVKRNAANTVASIIDPKLLEEEAIRTTGGAPA